MNFALLAENTLIASTGKPSCGHITINAPPESDLLDAKDEGYRFFSGDWRILDIYFSQSAVSKNSIKSMEPCRV